MSSKEIKEITNRVEDFLVNSDLQILNAVSAVYTAVEPLESNTNRKKETIKHAIEIAVACPVQKKLVVELIEAEFGIAFVKLNEVDLCSIYDNRSEAKICSGRKEPIDTFAIE